MSGLSARSSIRRIMGRLPRSRQRLSTRIYWHGLEFEKHDSHAYTPKAITFVRGSLRRDWWSIRNHRSLGWTFGSMAGASTMLSVTEAGCIYTHIRQGGHSHAVGGERRTPE